MFSSSSNNSSDSIGTNSSRPSSPPLPNKRRTAIIRDENGFKIKRNAIDSKSTTAFEQLGGGSNTYDKTLYEEEVDNFKYVIDGPLRKVPPYFFTYLTFCKLRWIGKKLIDVFADEFRLYPRSYYEKTIKSGKVTINKKVADIDTVLKNGDLISHKIHRHEPPVTSVPIKIVFEDDEIIVIDKPSGIPAHPTGRFRYNTVTKVMEKEYGKVVHTCNRLDRLTSGLMFLGKTAEATAKLVNQIKCREVSKKYIARVYGNFPSEDSIECDKPLRTVEPRLALNIVDEIEGKEAKTVFSKISYDKETNTSIVLCKPLTGRTHQIRVHLQYLGHPIANDPLYSSPKIWGSNFGKNADYKIEEVIEKLNKIGKTDTATSWFYPDSAGELLTSENCEICQIQLYSDPGPNDLNLWLHSFEYESNVKDSWSYRTELPDWVLATHKPFMELALKEANNCAETKTAFSVGCVIVDKNGEILSTGYSRELPGNTHAEQCALEKIYEKIGKRQVPKGSVLYTTMEPCSERLSGNLPCADRIIDDGNIKTCFVGVLEPDTFIKKNVGYSKLKEHGLNYLKIPGYEEECLKVAFKGHEDK
ncbi:hypothetical protein PACTADRAFT_48974 [Pachysolen tannophilus NRRL Y-2460]|uniref:tRNA pseudouridine(32) synthase n=1 Tax=Pachysolen tannophilus NRRL Y-2460 TaxID=669874 RepID=A0A1E4TZQ1_PACTA|nr:hypothetical protein PACTADRAFT_48974 [Pachysolen tannophilus NRRL Y-2460]